jgi:hypothetical protein
VEPLEVVGDHGNRVHVLDGVQGRLSVSYSATVEGHGKGVSFTEQDRIVYSRPSRFAESDRLLNFAAKEFGTGRAGSGLVQDVTSWVGSRLNYVPGSSGPTDGVHAVTEVAVDGEWQVVDATLLAPRQSLLRISTGRDAADTAFLTSFGGGLVLEASVVTAGVDGDLPVDDVHETVVLG